MLNSAASLIGIISNVVAQAYELARQRLASSGSPVLRMMIQRDHAVTDASLSDREMAVLRGSREGMKPKSRPAYTGTQRLEILQIMRLRGWTIAETAARFVLHANTVGTWLRAMENDGAASKLFTAPCGTASTTRCDGPCKRSAASVPRRRLARERSRR